MSLRLIELFLVAIFSILSGSIHATSKEVSTTRCPGPYVFEEEDVTPAGKSVQQSVDSKVLEQINFQLQQLQITNYVSIEALCTGKYDNQEKNYHISFRYKVLSGRGAELQNYDEKKYYDTNNQSYWTKIFLIIAEKLNGKLSMITGYGPGTYYCRSSIIYLARGIVVRGENGCMASVMFQGLNNPTEPKLIASESEVKTVKFSMSDIEKALDKYYSKFNLKATYLDSSEFHIMTTTYPAKNIILKGEDLWEKINTVFTLIPPKDKNSIYNLQVVTDAYYSSKAGAPPSLSSYEKSMEPKYYKELDEFNRSLSAEIARILQQK